MNGEDSTAGPAVAGAESTGACAEPDCAEAEEQLYEFLDGELDADTLGAIEAHIHKCSPCLDAFDFHTALRKVIASKCSETMPDDLKSRLVGMLDQAARKPG